MVGVRKSIWKGLTEEGGRGRGWCIRIVLTDSPSLCSEAFMRSGLRGGGSGGSEAAIVGPAARPLICMLTTTNAGTYRTHTDAPLWLTHTRAHTHWPTDQKRGVRVGGKDVPVLSLFLALQLPPIWTNRRSNILTYVALHREKNITKLVKVRWSLLERLHTNSIQKTQEITP